MVRLKSPVALLIYRPKGSPSAALTRILRCGGAHVLLVRGKHFSTPDCPFLLPDGWLDISVKSRDRNILVTP